MKRLPIDEVLPAIVESLSAHPSLVIRAPPGAGKTTRVPTALLDAGLIPPRQRVLMLEPRRVAARAAARRIADERGGRVGDEIGYHVRFEDRTSSRTRLAILTEGLLVRKLQDDPTLEGIAAVVLDELHERSIHADLALAFLREAQATVRPDLRIVVMSATLETGPVAAYLGGCPIIESEGRSYPVESFWLEGTGPLEIRVPVAIRRALREDERGDVLVFLPGAPEIRRVQERLDLAEVDVRPLHGTLEPEAQDAAILPGTRRKVVLATNIAETSLTIEGVTSVIDSGLVKIVRHDPGRGIDRLDTVRISRASAEQRAGRAGRTQPGRVYRLWSEEEHRRLAERDTPEVTRIDLAPTLLEVVAWTGADPKAFAWFEAPPLAMIERALHLLRLLGAVEKSQFRLTDFGRRLRAFPLHPRVAAVMVEAQRQGLVDEGALLCAMASEPDVRADGRDLSGPSDLLARAPTQAARRARDQLVTTAERVLGRRPPRIRGSDELRLLLAGFPDRVARRRAPSSDRFRLVGGRGAVLSRESVVKEASLLLALELDDTSGGADSLIRTASAIEESWLPVQTVPVVRWNAERLAAEGMIERRYLDLVLSERIDPNADPEALSSTLAERAAADLSRALAVSDEAESLLLRVELLRAHVPELDLPEIPLQSLLPELCAGNRSFADLGKADLVGAIRARLGYKGASAVDRQAPERWMLDSGRSARIRYERSGPPVLSVQIQRLFGATTTPRIAQGRVALRIELLAPNQRPVQVTQDLASFWVNTYPEIRKQLRARYPKHAWPEDPLSH